MRILLAASTLDPAEGGLPVCVGHLAATLGLAGHDVTVVGQVSEKAWRDAAVTHRGIRMEPIVRPWTVFGQAMAARTMAQFVRGWLRSQPRNGEPAVVHTHGVWTPAIVAAASTALREKVRLVISPHGMLRREPVRHSRFLKMTAWCAVVGRQLSAAGAVHVTSVAEKDDLRQLLPRIEPVLVPWGVESPAARPQRDDHARPRVAAYLGRLLPIKGLDMLIEAWSVVRPEGWVLRLAGPCDDAMAANLRARITTHGLADAIRLEPPISRDEVDDFFARADLFILPSRSENFGLVAGEALAMGVPVVATTETAWTELAAMGCGWCVPADTPSLAHALRTATATPEPMLRDMGRRGAAWIKRDFAWSTIAARLVRDAYTTR